MVISTLIELGDRFAQYFLQRAIQQRGFEIPILVNFEIREDRSVIDLLSPLYWRFLHGKYSQKIRHIYCDIFSLEWTVTWWIHKATLASACNNNQQPFGPGTGHLNSST